MTDDETTMTLEELFTPAREMLDEARDHLRDFEAECRKYLANNDVVYSEYERGDWTVLVARLVAPIPRLLRTRSLSCLLAARHALDQAVYAGQMHLTGKVFKKYFPLGKELAAVEASIRDYKIRPELGAEIIGARLYEPSPEGVDFNRVGFICGGKHRLGLAARVDPVRAMMNVFVREVRGGRLEGGPGPRTPDAIEGEVLRWQGELDADFNVRVDDFTLSIKDDIMPRIPAQTIMRVFIDRAAQFVDAAEAACR